MSNVFRRTSSIGCCALVLAAAAGALLSAPAFAADRVVLLEDFNATWCGPCITSGGYLTQLQDNYPDTLIVLNPHVADAYTITWGTARSQSYPSSGFIPNVWFDGATQFVGVPPGGYAQYLSIYNSRRAVATDVAVDLGGELVSGQTFDFTARVTLEPTGTAKTVTVYIIACLDRYPELGTHYRNCVMQVAPTQTVSLNPGQSVEVTRTLTMDSASWARQTKMHMVAWAQTPGSSGVRPVFNSRMIEFPFTPLPPLFALGDLNCSGGVDFDDIDPFVLALTTADGYATAYPTCDRMLADVNQDSAVNFDDIDAFVGVLAGG